MQASNVRNYTVRELGPQSRTTTTSSMRTPLGLLSKTHPSAAPRPGTRKVGAPQFGKLRPHRFYGDPHPRAQVDLLGQRLDRRDPGNAGEDLGPAPGRLKPAHGLTDVEGNAINQGGKPGKISLSCILGIRQSPDEGRSARRAAPSGRIPSKRWASDTLALAQPGVLALKIYGVKRRERFQRV